MKTQCYFLLAAPVLALLGCSGSGSGGNGGGGGTPPPQTTEVMYGISVGSVQSFKIDSQSGALTQQQEITLNTNGVAIAGVVDQSGPFLYLTDMGTGSNYPLVAAYSLDSSGNMTAVNGSPITVGNVGGEYALLLAVSPNGQYLYISDGNSFLESAKINSDGSLTAVSNTYLAADTTVNDMVVGTSGEYLYMSSAFGGVVAVQLNADGSMSEVAGSPFDLKLNSTPTSIYLAPSGNYLYTVLTNDPGNAFGSIQVDSIAATGVPQAVNGSPFPVGAFPLGFTTNPAGSFAYVPDIEQNVPQYPDRMRGFSIDSSTGTFAQLSGFSDDYLLNSNVTLTGFLGTAVDPSGSYLYAASGWVTPSGDLPEGIMGYSVNSTSGLITPLPGFPITEPAGAYQILFAQFK